MSFGEDSEGADDAWEVGSTKANAMPMKAKSVDFVRFLKLQRFYADFLESEMEMSKAYFIDRLSQRGLQSVQILENLQGILQAVSQHPRRQWVKPLPG